MEEAPELEGVPGLIVNKVSERFVFLPALRGNTYQITVLLVRAHGNEEPGPCEERRFSYLAELECLMLSGSSDWEGLSDGPA